MKKKSSLFFEKEKIISYLKSSLLSLLIIFFFLILTYGQRIFSNSFSMDTEHYLYSYSSNFEWWYSLNRWGLVLINKVFNFTPLVFWVSNILMFLMIFLSSIGFCYLFYLCIDDKYKKGFIKFQFIFPIIFFTNPIFAEQFNFLNQNFGVAFGIFLCCISLLVIVKASLIDYRIKYIYYFISILVSTLSFGIYQALIPLYILGIFCCYFLRLFFSQKKENFKFLIANFLIFIISCILYVIISRLAGPSNSYLKFGWMNAPILECIRNIFNVVISTLKCHTIFYNVSYLIALFLFVIFCFYNFKKFSFERLFVVGVLLLSPFYLMIITGVDQLKRTQFNYSYFIGFVFLIFVVFLYDKLRVKKIIYVLILIILGIGYRQAYISANLFYSDNLRFNSDVVFANKLQYDIEQLEQYNSSFKYTIVFVGHHYDRPFNSWLSGEVMGSSFFDFDYEYIYGVNQRANIFLKTLGYDYDFSSIEQFEWAKDYSSKMSSYPHKDYVCIKDNLVIVKLSDDI